VRSFNHQTFRVAFLITFLIILATERSCDERRKDATDEDSAKGTGPPDAHIRNIKIFYPVKVGKIST